MTVNATPDHGDANSGVHHRPGKLNLLPDLLSRPRLRCYVILIDSQLLTPIIKPTELL